MGEVASGPFCLLVNSPWLLVFALCVFFLSLVGFNIYCWKGIHFSWSNFLIFLYLFLHLVCSFHFFLLFLVSEGLLFVSFFWASFHSLSSPTLGIWPGEGFYLPDPCELTFANTLLLSNAAVSLGGAFVSLEISSQFLVCKSKNFVSWVYRLMIRFIVLCSFSLQDYISFIFSLVFFFWVFSFGVVVFLQKFIIL